MRRPSFTVCAEAHHLRAAALLLAAIASPLGAQLRPVVRTPRIPLAEPAIAPDRAEIAFVSGGDIWVVPAAGGEARLLIAHPANESRPMYSPDGTRLAFMSNRAGSMDIWLLSFATGELRRLTYDDGAEQLDGWSRDGKWVYFSSSAHDVSSTTDELRVRADGGTAMAVSADRYASEFMGAPSPDGATMAVVARGFSQSQWWRKGSSHLDKSELWLVRGDGAAAPRYEQLTRRDAKQQWPMWSADGATLYFVSDRNGAQNLWARPMAGQADAHAVTSFRDGRVMWPTISNDGKTIVFERDFAIWSFDVTSGQARQVPITLRGASSGEPAEHLTLTTFQEMGVSPDGKKLAFVARGEIFATSTTDGGDAVRLTNTPAIESQIAWAPDSRRIAYASNRDGAWHLYLYDFATNAERQLTRGDKSDVSPRWSPDGKQIAFIRDARELRVLDVVSGAGRDRVLAQGYFGRAPFLSARPIVWSPDGRWIAYAAGGTKLFVNAYVVSLSASDAPAGGIARQVSFLANTRDATLSWGADGSYLLLGSGQRGEPGIIARVDLVPRTPRFREDQFSALFRDVVPGRAVPTSPPPTPRETPAQAPDSMLIPETKTPSRTRIVAEGIRDRLTVLPVGVDPDDQAISPDGKQLLLVANAAGQQNIYVYSLDELSNEPPIARQLTTTAGRKTSAQWAPDSKSIYYLEQGRIANVTVDNRTTRQIAARAELDVDFAREKMEVFHQAWEYLNDNFWDPTFLGVNWNAVHDQYAPLVAGAHSPDEMRRLLSLMVGELNASHLGISGPNAGTGQPGTGRLGLHFERAAYEQRGELKVSEVIPLSPAALSEKIKVGDFILSVDGAPVKQGFNLDSALSYKFNRKVSLVVASDAGGRDKHDVAVRAVNGNTEKALLYRAWVSDRRAYVEKISNGRLGYVHMLDMGGNAIPQMNLDLDSENHGKEGVVLDLRNNNGGSVNGHALDVLSRQPYVLMVRRGVPPVPGRPVLGQRALEAPTILVINQHTLSDGENFTEGYRTMKLGKVVGEPTAQWDVYTGGGTMIDGTSVRLPFMTNAALDGSPLELKSRQVDIPVDRPLGESYTGRDSQLDTAVKELLAQIGTKSAKRPAATGK